MPFRPKNHKESLTKRLTSKLLSNSERNMIEEDLKFLKSMMTDIIATFGVKDVRLERKRKISNEIISKGKQIGKKPSSSSSTVKVSSGSSDNQFDDDNEDEDFMPQEKSKRPIKTGRNY